MPYSLQINIFSPKKTPLTAYFKQKNRLQKSHVGEVKKIHKTRADNAKKNKNQRKEQATQRGYKKDEIIEFESII